MISEYRLREWTHWAKRDDACKLFVPSDIREMLSEIERLRDTLTAIAKDESVPAFVRTLAGASVPTP